MILLSNNNASTTLAGPLNTGQTTITLATGTGAEFPSPGANEYFTLTLIDQLTQTQFEICWVTARTGDVCTVLRGQEGTAAQEWLIGDLAWGTNTSGSILGGRAFSSTNTPTLPFTVPSAHHGIAQVFAGNGTLTLPPTSGLRDGFLCPISVDGNFTVTVNTNSATVVTPTGNVTGTFAVSGYNSVQLVWSALAGVWLMIGQTSPIQLTPFIPLLNTTTNVCPVGYSRLEVILQGGGGGGCDCQGGNQSGGGGGAGGTLHAVFNAVAGTGYQFNIGNAGAAQSNGGATELYLSGTTLMGHAGGGNGSVFVGGAISAGGGGGTVSTGTALNYVVLSLVGGFGSDGQGGSRIGFGNGAASPYGGNGRGGSAGGEPATGYGAGGGGAYNQDPSDSNTYVGAPGSPGIAFYRWLP